MRKECINPPSFTPAMGAYSHGLKVELSDAVMIFVTGQIALDAEGKVVSDDIGDQTRFVFENIRKILAAAGSSFQDVVKAQIFLTNIGDFSHVSPIRNEYFGESKPVSTLLEVSALVKAGCKIEIEVIAIAARVR